MKYLLDTDHISFLQRRGGSEYATLSLRMSHHQPTDFAFAIVSFHEQILGAHTFLARSHTIVEVTRGYLLFQEILRSFAVAPVLPFDTAAASVWDGLRIQRVRVATMDLRIAAIALAANLVLLTRNIADFSRVPGLITEDWTL